MQERDSVIPFCSVLFLVVQNLEPIQEAIISNELEARISSRDNKSARDLNPIA
jgi:hypothetical protein